MCERERDTDREEETEERCEPSSARGAVVMIRADGRLRYDHSTQEREREREVHIEKGGAERERV